MTFQATRRRFTVDEYLRMAEVGIFEPNECVELIRGEIVEMSPSEPPHASIVIRLINMLIPRFQDVALVTAQTPAVVSDDSAPEPDVMLVRKRDDFYATFHPTPEDILLAIEVSDSSLS